MEQINPEPTSTQVPVMKKLPNFKLNGKKNLMIVGILVAVFGLLTGWMLSKQGVGRNMLGLSPQAGSGSKAGTAATGLADESTFKDTAEGKLEEGGINGEGTHHLVRDGGPSQNVYLTSTAVNLQDFVGKKVKVWGQTISARKAGWLMDVGKIQVIE